MRMEIRRNLEQCSICFFAGSIIPEEILSHCGPSTKKINTAPLSLSQIIEKIEKFHNEGHEIARLHSGDLSIWSAVNEQIRELIKLEILPRKIPIGAVTATKSKK